MINLKSITLWVSITTVILLYYNSIQHFKALEIVKTIQQQSP